MESSGSKERKIDKHKEVESSSGHLSDQPLANQHADRPVVPIPVRPVPPNEHIQKADASSESSGTSPLTTIQNGLQNEHHANSGKADPSSESGNNFYSSSPGNPAPSPNLSNKSEISHDPQPATFSPSSDRSSPFRLFSTFSTPGSKGFPSRISTPPAIPEGHETPQLEYKDDRSVHRTASGKRQLQRGVSTDSSLELSPHRSTSGQRPVRNEDLEPGNTDDEVLMDVAQLGVHRRHQPSIVASPPRPNHTDLYRSRRQQRHPRFKRKEPNGIWRLGRWIRSCLFAGIPAYLLATLFFFRHASKNRLSYRIFVELASDAAKLRDQRRFKDRREADLFELVQKELEKNGSERRTRSKPPAITVVDERVDSYDVWLSDQHERAPHMNIDTEHSPPADINTLCGYLARTASVTNRISYVQRDALNSKARVIITGILNPTGFHLALALKERCGVELIIGIDNMFPNTVKSRLDLIKPMEILYTTIPKLSRPIYASYVGIDPTKPPKKNSPSLDMTGELNLYGAFQPTHIIHLGSISEDAYFSSTDSSQQKNAMFSFRSALAGMEQILSSIASVSDKTKRPHLMFASSNLFHERIPSDWMDILHGRSRLMDEIMADFYYAKYGVESVALRLPNGIYGPWDRAADVGNADFWKVNSVLQSSLETHCTAENCINLTLTSSWEHDDKWDFLHVDDAVDTIIAAVQFRSPAFLPSTFEVTSGGTLSLSDVRGVAQSKLSALEKVKGTSLTSTLRAVTEYDYIVAARKAAEEKLSWHKPRVTLEEGLTRTLAWVMDQSRPFPSLHKHHDAAGEQTINPDSRTGDNLLIQNLLPTCGADDVLCHRGQKYLPCASSCTTKQHCLPSLFDSVLEVFSEVTEGCDIVLYTHQLGKDVSDLQLQAEYMEEGDPLICNVAVVSRESPLVESVIKKVPDDQLVKLGVEVNPQDRSKKSVFHQRKISQLNGRLLFRGWVLIWPEDETPEPLQEHEAALLKLTPNAFFASDVKYALYIDQTFTVSPSLKDIQFLVSEMQRSHWPTRLVKRKTTPKAKFVLPAEPNRRAVILMSELKYQDSATAERLPPDTTIEVYEATRFMRFELGEEPLGKEPFTLKLQREFYQKLPSIINRDQMRCSTEGSYKFNMSKFWARTRWILHDMKLEEAHQLRCDWYQEHIHWGTKLDQLSLSFIMARRDVERRIAHMEPDDNVLKPMQENIEMKRLLSDTFEWHSILTEQNKHFAPYEMIKVLPYGISYNLEEEQYHGSHGQKPPLFARIISDRTLSLARKEWNRRNK
jgi:nucleoside-diphosphate-sugar epimerase